MGTITRVGAGALALLVSAGLLTSVASRDDGEPHSNEARRHYEKRDRKYRVRFEVHQRRPARHLEVAWRRNGRGEDDEVDARRWTSETNAAWGDALTLEANPVGGGEGWIACYIYVNDLMEDGTFDGTGGICRVEYTIVR